ncbi:hypothetical protein ABZ776_28220 [Streptomyces sp. NPDC007076]|uniref:hypothetical protein n=1 Tax=unclassified Streptomyces TaxID=2593676 RepID=UPI0033918287
MTSEVPPDVWEPGDMEPEFFLDVPGAKLVTTDVLLQVQDTISETVDARAMSLAACAVRAGARRPEFA